MYNGTERVVNYSMSQEFLLHNRNRRRTHNLKEFESAHEREVTNYEILYSQIFDIPREFDKGFYF